MIPTTMRAVVLDAPGPPDALQVRDVAMPTPEPGEVLIEIRAFGLNRSELHTRLGLADGVTFPACSVSRPRVWSPRVRAENSPTVSKWWR